MHTRKKQKLDTQQSDEIKNKQVILKLKCKLYCLGTKTKCWKKKSDGLVSVVDHNKLFKIIYTSCDDENALITQTVTKDLDFKLDGPLKSCATWKASNNEIISLKFRGRSSCTKFLDVIDTIQEKLAGDDDSNSDETDQENSPKRKPFAKTCQTCGKFFQNSYSYNFHIRIHQPKDSSSKNLNDEAPVQRMEPSSSIQTTDTGCQVNLDDKDTSLFNAIARSFENGEEDNTLLQMVSNTPWKMHRLGVLNKFSCDQKSLKRYSSLLSELMENEQHLASFPKNATRAQLFMETSSTLKEGTDICWICVKSDNEANGAFTGLLFKMDSWSKANSVELEQDDELFPIFLSKGSSETTDLVRKFLQANFECLLGPIIQEQSEFLYLFIIMADLCCSLSEEEKKQRIKVNYKMEADLEWIRFDLDIKSHVRILNSIWPKLVQNINPIPTLKQLNDYFAIIHDIFYKYFSCKLEQSRINLFSSPIAKMDSTGNLMVFKRQYFEIVLERICDFIMQKDYI